ncbi:hypothetical protein OS493_002022 [Desmophyllum pertusum]|uniref:Uncharacterized protein n=1 Tax=Desmophyllum pertusum TaxID=174260 RepID=A0A9W9Z5E0_9CNID|nr:hypothetical protein OS493_002022 [Desmophyllum pertusum]
MSSDSSDNAEAENLSDAESDTSDFSDNGETESKTTGTKRSRKFRQMPKEYDSTDSSDQEEIAVKKRSRKRPKIKDLTDKGSEGSTSSDHEPIFDEREDSNHDETNPITTQQRRNDSIIQRRLRENNRLNRNDSCENIDDLTRDGDNDPGRSFNDSDLASGSESSDINQEISSNLSESSDTIQGNSSDLSDSQKTSSDDEEQAGYSSGDDLSEDEQPVCQGTIIKRKTFEATFLALSNKHNFSKSTRTDILKFMETFIPKPNLPSSNYMFENKLVQGHEHPLLQIRTVHQVQYQPN